MSVLMRGVNMPKNCEECNFKGECRNYWEKIREAYTRPSWCPLVEVADRKTENSSEKPNNCELQTIRCPKCGRTDYIRDMEKDMGIKGSCYEYKCINCNTYIKDEPQTERSSE